MTGMVPAGGRPGVAPGDAALFGAGLFALFLANCLLISWAESEHDARHDPASFAAGHGKGLRGICLGLIAAAFVAGGVLALKGSLGVSSTALVVAAVLEGSVVPLAARRSPFTQPIADGVLLVPWICGWLVSFP